MQTNKHTTMNGKAALVLNTTISPALPHGSKPIERSGRFKFLAGAPLLAAALLMSATEGHGSLMIGAKYVNGAFSNQSAMLSTDVAGASGFAQANWNNSFSVVN